MNQNSNPYTSNEVVAAPRPAYIVDLAGSKVSDVGVTRQLSPGPALMMELPPAMERALLGKQPLKLKLGLMARANEMVGLAILRAGRHVCIAAMDCGDADVAQLLHTSRVSKSFRIALIGQECRRLELFTLQAETMETLNRLVGAAQMDLARYLAAVRVVVAEACSPAGMTAAGLDPRRVRSISVFAHVGEGLLAGAEPVFEQQDLPLH